MDRGAHHYCRDELCSAHPLERALKMKSEAEEESAFLTLASPSTVPESERAAVQAALDSSDSVAELVCLYPELCWAITGA